MISKRKHHLPWCRQAACHHKVPKDGYLSKQMLSQQENTILQHAVFKLYATQLATTRAKVATLKARYTLSRTPTLHLIAPTLCPIATHASLCLRPTTVGHTDRPSPASKQVRLVPVPNMTTKGKPSDKST
jgi:hypothetical protein